MNKTNPTNRDRDRVRKAAWRRKQGMVPQAQRQTTKRAGEIAESAGVSIATVYRHHKAGTLDALLFDPGSLRKKCPPVPKEDAKEVSAQNGVNEKFLSVDTSFSSSGISLGQRDQHARTVAKLLSEADDAQSDWLDTLPAWSM